MTVPNSNSAGAIVWLILSLAKIPSDAECTPLLRLPLLTTTLATLAPRPFFETALSGTGYCNGFANCTTAVVTNEFTNFQNQLVWGLWSDLDKGGSASGFNFPFSSIGEAAIVNIGHPESRQRSEVIARGGHRTAGPV